MARIGERYRILIGIFFLFFSCSSPSEKAPSGLTSWPPIPEVYHNSYSASRFALGEKLFFEKRLSKDNALSCASCHNPQFAFSDQQKISPGVSKSHSGFRNTPTLLNLGYAPHLMSEGGISSLENLSISPLQDENEMGQNIGESLSKIATDQEYLRLFSEAYDTVPSIKYMARALAVYQRYLISKGSRYDAYISGKKNALRPDEIRGMQLFFSQRTQCSSCHSGFLFSDFSFHHIGLSDMSGDPGRMRLTGDPKDALHFKTPSLRNIELSFPYMHDGRFLTLDEVLAHYNKGGDKIEGQSEKVKALHLNATELSELKAFLLTLTDTIQYTHVAE